MSSGGKAPVYAGGPWYVAPTGAAANDCRTPATACRTIGAAVQKAAGGDTIHIAAGTYAETLALPRSLTLEGAGAGSTIIDGRATGTVMRISPPAVANLLGLTIRNGASSGAGGGIQNNGTLTLDASTVVSNTASSGGGIFNAGSLTLRNSMVVSNTATLGGGIFNQGQLDVDYGTINSNSVTSTSLTGATAIGGGIYITNGDVHLRNSSVAFNIAFVPPSCQGSGAVGGGIYVGQGSTLVLSRSTINANRAEARDSNCGKPGANASAAGGGIANDGYLGLDNSTISDNTAIADTHFDFTAIMLPVATATGGGIANTGLAYLNSGTISHNAAQASALQDPPIVGEPSIGTEIASGGGIHSAANISATLGVTIEMTLLAGNAATTGPDCNERLSSKGHNLIQDASGCTITGTRSTDKTGVNPLLGPLAANSGVTFTHALLPGSPAIDAGGATCIATDQRGYHRPADGDGDGNAACDIGAYEVVIPFRYLPLISRP
ncbi:MAG: choice-of-anchor Q domain-containing protein [Roseiflexaceae bacterium]